MENLQSIGPFIMVCALLIGLAFLIRAFGAWMLRIDELILNQKEQTKTLKRISEDIQNKMYSDDKKANQK
ncbi:hypothetical protein ACFX5E_02020 [Flavobacterium sp. LS2P90]|uniref:Uncharacterized protein n=1 Tax=Flavobacterium xylosi TaxID=3230415 RepID=A0ABW6HTT5_9FLAO